MQPYLRSQQTRVPQRRRRGSLHDDLGAGPRHVERRSDLPRQQIGDPVLTPEKARLAV